MSVSESQTNVVYKVDDRTGPLVDVKSGWTTRSWRRSQVQVCMYMCIRINVVQHTVRAVIVMMELV